METGSKYPLNVLSHDRSIVSLVVKVKERRDGESFLKRGQ